MVNNHRITKLLQDFSDGTIGKNEYAELIHYFNLKGNDEEIYAAMDELWKNTLAEAHYTKEEEEAFYQKLVNGKDFHTNAGKTKPVRLWYKIAAAAAVLAVLSIGIYDLSSQHGLKDENRFAKNDIAPGGNKALLTLSNGKSINLNEATDGKLASENGISITKAKSGELVYTISDQGKASSKTRQAMLNTISTPKGGQWQVRLPDGSVIWLNAATVLKYPVTFSGKKERRVELTGEAYFEIAKDKTKPFIVHSFKQEVKVLGTHFNVNAYENEPVVRTTLLEGSVQLETVGGRGEDHPEILKPGEQASLTGNGFKIAVTNVLLAIDWKNNEFRFKNEPLPGIMRKVARWYDVDIVYLKEEKKMPTFSGSVSRSQDVSEILKMLEEAGDVNFSIEGKTIRVR